MSERIRLNDGFDHLRDRIQGLEAELEQVQSERDRLQETMKNILALQPKG